MYMKHTYSNWYKHLQAMTAQNSQAENFTTIIPAAATPNILAKHTIKL